ncbi:LysR family transcriptional regulator [Asticcacaulis excentricus]|uniref:LysR family transcriptional regulator n=1 Tax=Asticcacaulis excentricus TaxID=78587 RepID=UPI0018D566C6|nr:LysR family transcriptional regulator [Asticcacaulis excentricus]
MTNIRNLDLNLLKAFDALMDTRSVTRAAERLGLSQPAVSQMLPRLKDAFGEPLFVRAQRGILPTPRAEALAGPVRRALFDIERLLKPEAFIPANATLTINVAATDYALKAVLSPFMAILRKEAPHIRVSAKPVDLDSLNHQLENGSLDMAFITQEMASEALRSRKLFDETYVTIRRKGHPTGSGPLDVEQFCSANHALMSHDGSKFTGVIDAALARIGRKRHVVAAVPSFLLLIDLVRHSDLVATVPGRLVTDTTDFLVQTPPVAVPGFTKILVWHERLQGDPAHIWLREKIAEIIRSA